MIQVAAVSYLNTKPLLKGLSQGKIAEQINLHIDYPSKIAEGLKSGQYDLGLVPVAIMPELSQAKIISDYGIAAHGAVASVSIFSQQPIENLKTIYLDYQSRTSVQLAQILVKKYFKLDHITFLPAPDNYMDLIQGDIGGVIIGDRALRIKNDYPYDYDLGELWMEYTGKPFVFAAWIATKDLDPNFIKDFNEANAVGLNQIPNIAEEFHIDYYDLNTYYTRDIKFNIGQEEKEGLDLFLQYLNENNLK